MTLNLKGKLLLAGAGKMGGAMLAGWLDRGLDPRQIIVQDPAPPPGELVDDEALADAAAEEPAPLEPMSVKPVSKLPTLYPIVE